MVDDEKENGADKRTSVGGEQIFLRRDIVFYRSMVSCHSFDHLLVSIGRIGSLCRGGKFSLEYSACILLSASTFCLAIRLS